VTDRPLVHIGYHKTASTWLQKTYFPSVRNASLVPRQVAIDAFLEVGALRFDPEQTRRRLEEAAPGRLILSLEGLSGYLHNGGLSGALSKDMAHRLKTTLPDADIVVFIRRQPDVLAASYAQYVRYGGTHPAERYLFPGEYKSLKHTRRDKNPRFELDHFDYLPLLRLYRDLFGADRVHVYLYEALRSEYDVFVEAFNHRFGLQCTELPDTGAPVNRSLSPAALAVVRRINLFNAARVHDKRHFVHVPGMFWLGRGVGRVLTRLFPAERGSDLSKLVRADVLHRIEAHYAEANRQLAVELDLPLAQYGYPVARTGPAAEPVSRPAAPGACRAAS
jgi:hypothetical protein